MTTLATIAETTTTQATTVLSEDEHDLLYAALLGYARTVTGNPLMDQADAAALRVLAERVLRSEVVALVRPGTTTKRYIELPDDSLRAALSWAA